MPHDLPIRCECGKLRGVLRGVDESRGNRLVCYCDDCQSFAHFLCRGDQVLDSHGGTDLFQTAPSRIELTEGASQLACMNLKEGGLMRWYASCCDTPIANTMRTHQVPFAGIIDMCIDHAADGRSRDDTLGPIRGRSLTEFAKGDLKEAGATGGRSGAMLWRIAKLILKWRLRGEHQPSPFYQANGEPVSVPRVLTEAERTDVESRRDS